MQSLSCSGRTLAFLGDAVWSLEVRGYLVEKGLGKGSDLQTMSIHYVSAKAQASFYKALHEMNFFTEAEEDTFHRGRNSSAGTVPHSASPQTYRISTGFEAILGALYLEGNETRIHEIWDKVRTLKEN